MKIVLRPTSLLLLTVIASGRLQAMKPVKKHGSEHFFQQTLEKPLLNQIADFAYIIADTSDKKIGLDAKKHLQSLVKQLDSEIHDELFEDCNAIITNYLHNHIKVVEACHRLTDKIQAIKAQQQLIHTTKDATTAVNAVSDKLKPMVIAEQKERINQKTKIAQEKGFLAGLKTRIFGDKISWAKTSFYAAVGAATLAGLYYGYPYLENIKKTGKKYWDTGTTPFMSIEAAEKNVTDATIEAMYIRVQLKKALEKDPDSSHSAPINELRERLSDANDKVIAAQEQLQSVKWFKNHFQQITVNPD